MEPMPKFRIPMFSDKDTFCEFQYVELGDIIEVTLCGYNGKPQKCSELPDKNGKIIYEGDKVTRNYVTPTGKATEEEDSNFIKEVVFFKGCFGVFSKTDFIPIIDFLIAIVANTYLTMAIK